MSGVGVLRSAACALLSCWWGCGRYSAWGIATVCEAPCQVLTELCSPNPYSETCWVGTSSSSEQFRPSSFAQGLWPVSGREGFGPSSGWPSACVSHHQRGGCFCSSQQQTGGAFSPVEAWGAAWATGSRFHEADSRRRCEGRTTRTHHRGVPGHSPEAAVRGRGQLRPGHGLAERGEAAWPCGLWARDQPHSCCCAAPQTWALTYPHPSFPGAPGWRMRAVSSSQTCRCCSLRRVPLLCDPKDCSPPGSPGHGDSPGKNAAWVAISPPGGLPAQRWDPGLLRWQAESSLRSPERALVLERRGTVLSCGQWLVLTTWLIQSVGHWTQTENNAPWAV